MFGKDRILKYAFSIGLVTLPLAIAENVANHIDMSNLEKEASVVKKDSTGVANLYGFDDNNDGDLDRIEIRGTIPPRPRGMGPVPVAYHKTVTSSDSDFSRYKRDIDN